LLKNGIALRFRPNLRTPFSVSTLPTSPSAQTVNGEIFGLSGFHQSEPECAPVFDPPSQRVKETEKHRK
jgi:hypothetical protein